jgi:hypothetical protein
MLTAIVIFRAGRRASFLKLTAGIIAVAAAVGCGATTETELVGPEALRCPVLLDGATSLPASQSQALVQVIAARECQWSAATNAVWLQPSPRGGTGSVAITLTAMPNIGTTARSAVLTVNEQPWTVTQAAAGTISSVSLSARSTLQTRSPGDR